MESSGPAKSVPSTKEHLSDALSTISIGDVDLAVFPTYSTRGSIDSDVSSAFKRPVTTECKDGIQPCYYFIRGQLCVIEFDQEEREVCKFVRLDKLPDSSPGKFHCSQCLLNFENKTTFLIHLLRSGESFDEHKAIHIVCPICFEEFLGTDRIGQMVNHVDSVSVIPCPIPFHSFMFFLPPWFIVRHRSLSSFHLSYSMTSTSAQVEPRLCNTNH